MRSAGFVLLALVACNGGSDAPPPKPPPAPVKVEVVTAAEAPSPDVLVLTGIVTADQRAEVTADVAGKVVGVMVERGQRVKMGDPVVRLDVRSAALSEREAQANLAAASAQKRLAEEECKRAQALLDKGAITRSEYDRQSTQCTAALQQVSAAQARAEMFRKSVSDGLVRAPFDGLVAEKQVTPGEWVAPGRPLFALVDDDPLRVELSVPELAVPAIRDGQKVQVTAVATKGKNYEATITRIGVEIGQRRSMTIEATLAKGSDLVPGMFVEANVVIGQTPRPVVPESAVAKRGKTWHAFVVRNGEVEERIIQKAASLEPGKVAIQNGVATGEQVVATVTPQIVDGLRVDLPAK